MRIETGKQENHCPREEIAAFVDGELDSREEFALERHLTVCETCRSEYRSQRQLLCALDSMLVEENDAITVPTGFTRVVAANAESSITGIRSRKEWSRALLVCALLILPFAAGFGGQSGPLRSVLGKFADRSIAVMAFAFHLVYELAVGMAVVLGSVCKEFVFGSVVSFGLLLFVFIISSVVLSRLIFRYNRL